MNVLYFFYHILKIQQTNLYTYNLITIKYQKAKRETDLCEYCDLLKNQHLHHLPAEHLEKLKVHHKTMEIKKNDYDRQFRNLQDGQSLVVFDFKQNLGLPMSPKEMSQDFFQKLPVSILTFVCFIKKNNNLFKKVFTFLSLCLNHNATFASDCLERVLNSAMYMDISKVYLWSDNGPHFHNNQFINFIFLKNNFKNKVIEYNFFCEKHGKAVCDQFFGSMTRSLNDLSKKSTISNINELLSSLCTDYYNKSNEYFFEMFFSFLLVFYNKY
ncbi:MAG: hypothetical protein LBF97_00180 [Elusimicrobiota bacterium]|nr:hypothetical protein [Elusimicrobiota bacterium]